MMFTVLIGATLCAFLALSDMSQVGAWLGVVGWLEAAFWWHAFRRERN